MAKDGIAVQVMQTSRGTPAKLTLPKQAGAFQIRYMNGQVNLVLARAGIEIPVGESSRI